MSENNKSSGKTKSKSWFSFFKKPTDSKPASSPSQKNTPSSSSAKASSTAKTSTNSERSWGPGKGGNYESRGPRSETASDKKTGEPGQNSTNRESTPRSERSRGPRRKGPSGRTGPDTQAARENQRAPQAAKLAPVVPQNSRVIPAVTRPASLETAKSVTPATSSVTASARREPTPDSGQSFLDLALIEPLQKAVADLGYTHPTPIQQQAIPHLLAGKDLLGNAQTGTGKTAAFALPILQRLHDSNRRPEPKRFRTLVLTPTRELAVQIQESFKDYGKHLKMRSAVVFGGVGQGPQVAALKQGLDVLVATPGRFLDLLEQKHLDLGGIEIFVLDEADRMLDMGFIHDIKRIIKLLPAQRQNLFFSATMAPEIDRLASSFLRNPERVAVNPVSSTAELIDQKVIFVEKAHKRELLRYVLQDPALAKVIVFCRTKHGANQVSEMLEKNGFESAAIHGNKSQNARQKALESFREGKVRVLVATDIAARGIDIDEITHVINFELPNVPEDYVHRIGRTARAGASGQALSFCNQEERVDLKNIERLTGRNLEVLSFDDFKPSAVSSASSEGERRGGRGAGGGRGGNSRSGNRGGGARRGGAGRGASSGGGARRSTR